MTALAEIPPLDLGPVTGSAGDRLFAILDSQPETKFWRAEILDGTTITLSPTPTPLHQENVYRLDEQLRSQLPEGHRTEGYLQIRMEHLVRSVIPDLFVAPRDAFLKQGAWLVPDDVLLVAEVVSSGNVASDRSVKPGIYAQAMIPCFLSVDPLQRRTTVFSGPKEGEYQTSQWCEFGETVAISDPFEAEIDTSVFIPYE